MIITQKKPNEEVLELLRGAKKVLVTGCGQCASTCKTGGEAEVEEMAAYLREQGFEVVGTCIMPTSCNKNLVRKELKVFKGVEYDAIVSMACGDGVQTVAGNVEKPVYPANNTMFLGEIERLTLFSEACRFCGNCELGNTGGICPVTKCAKSLLNGPCGGSRDGKCEVNPENPCAWIEIYKRLTALGQLDRMMDIKPAKGHAKAAYPRVINLKAEEGTSNG